MKFSDLTYAFGLIMGFVLGFLGGIQFQQGKPLPFVEPTPVEIRYVTPRLDQVCPSWLFETNLRAAKQRMCGRP